MYYRKIVVMIMCLGSLMSLLTSCFIGSNDPADQAQARLEQVIKAINKKDGEAIRDMFSETAMDEAEEFDERLNYLFEFVQGDIISWTQEFGSAPESVNYGKNIKKFNCYYTILTDTQEYIIFLKECTVDTEHPENVGLYMLQVIKAQDRDTQFDWGGEKTGCAGIWLPEDAMQ